MNKVLFKIYTYQDKVIGKQPYQILKPENEYELNYLLTLSSPYALYTLYDTTKSLQVVNKISRRIRNWEKLPNLIMQKYEFELIFSCQHQISTAQIKCLKCDAFFDCKTCHDDFNDHSIEFGGIRCKKCENDLQMGKVCQVCEIQTYNHFCLECLEFSFKIDEQDTGKIKFTPQLRHCAQCKKCVSQQSFHCKKCRDCINFADLADHFCGFCPENCAVCGKCGVNFRLNCGCLSHQVCYYKTIQRGSFVCKVCNSGIQKLDTKEKQIEYIEGYMQKRIGDGVYRCICGNKFVFDDKKYAICEKCGSFECQKLSQQ